MDKVKQILELLRKHHFWILCGLAALVGLIVWQMSTGKLATEFQARSEAIDTKLRSIQPAPDAAHVDWEEFQKRETAKVVKDVKDAWEFLYNQQKEKIFVWPAELEEDFLQALAKVQGTKNEIDKGLRERYQEMVKVFAAKLPGRVEAEPVAAAPAYGIMAPVAAAVQPGAAEYKVIWATESLQSILQSFDWTERPFTWQIKQAQEELWVYQALCDIIKVANERATGNHDAAVKQIVDMKIAYATAESSSSAAAGQHRIDPIPGATAGADPAAGAPAGPDTKKPVPDLKSRGKAGGDHGGGLFGAAPDAPPASPEDKWKDYRYVKQVPGNSPTTEPMLKEDLDTSEKTSQYNLMPFQLTLVVDDRYIDRLLVAFRNSVLPIEVQQVRINPGTATTSVGGGGFFGGGGGGEHSERGPRPTAAVGVAAQPGQDRIATLEIRGVVYLLKPVDESLQSQPTGEPNSPDTNAAPAAAGPDGAAAATPAPAAP